LTFLGVFQDSLPVSSTRGGGFRPLMRSKSVDVLRTQVLQCDISLTTHLTSMVPTVTDMWLCF